MNEPLKGKRFGLFDYHTKQVIETNYQDSGKMFFDEDIKSAVEWLKEQIIITGGLAVSELIDKAFEDVTFNSIKETEVKKRLQLC